MEPLVATGTFIHNPFPNVVNGSLWTIRYEFYCYFLLLAMGALRLMNRRWMFIAFGGSLLIGTLLKLRGHQYWIVGIGSFEAWSRFLPYFLSGCLLFQFRELVPRRLPLFCSRSECGSRRPFHA